MSAGVQRRIADGFGSQRIDSRGKMTVTSDAFGEVRSADDLLDAGTTRNRLRARGVV